MKLPTGSHTFILVVFKIRHVTSQIAKDARYQRRHVSTLTTESHNCLLLPVSFFAKLSSIFFLVIVEKNSSILIQCCTNRRRQVFQSTKFCTEPPSFVDPLNLLHVTSSAPRIETASTFLSSLFNPGLMTCTFCYNFAPRRFEVFSILSFQVSCHHFLYTRLPSTGVATADPLETTVLKK